MNVITSYTAIHIHAKTWTNTHKAKNRCHSHRRPFLTARMLMAEHDAPEDRVFRGLLLAACMVHVCQISTLTLQVAHIPALCRSMAASAPSQCSYCSADLFLLQQRKLQAISHTMQSGFNQQSMSIHQTRHRRCH